MTPVRARLSAENIAGFPRPRSLCSMAPSADILWVFEILPTLHLEQLTPSAKHEGTKNSTKGLEEVWESFHSCSGEKPSGSSLFYLGQCVRGDSRGNICDVFGGRSCSNRCHTSPEKRCHWPPVSRVPSGLTLPRSCIALLVLLTLWRFSVCL